jgi:hypothetical protein
MAEKNVYEQLTDLQNQLAEMQLKPRTVQNLIAEDNPEIIEFVKNARRVWRFGGEKSELKRENKKMRRRCITALCLLGLYFIVPFLFITKPFGWILPIFSSIVCIGQAFLEFHIMKPREYEMPYDQISVFWKYAEYDDNEIISATKDRWWTVTLRIALFIIPFVLGIEMLVFFFDSWGAFAFCIVLWSAIPWAFLLDNTIYGYQLHFIDDKNDIEYDLLKDFMERNNLQ